MRPRPRAAVMNSIFGPPTNLAITPDERLVNGTTITDTGKKLELPGQPASMRGRAR